MSNNIDLSKITTEFKPINDNSNNNNNESDIKQDDNENMDSPILEELKEVEDIVYKSQLIQKIEGYYRIFNDFLKEININEINLLSVDELEKLLIHIKQKVSNRNIQNNMDTLIKSIPIGIEHICCNFTPIKLNGYSEMLNNDKEFYYNVHEILLEYDLLTNVQTRPEYRLGYQMCITGLLCHKLNTAKEQNLLNGLNKKPDIIFDNKYKDL